MNAPDWMTTGDPLDEQPSNEAPQRPAVPEPHPNVPSSLTTAKRSSEMLALEQQSFEIAFETALESLAAGLPLSTFCAEYVAGPPESSLARLSHVRFRTWIFKDSKRKQAYLTAKAIGAETVEDDLLRIADGIRPDGTASLDDVPRSQLRVNTRKWLLQVWNRRRYGDVKHIEQTTTTKVDVSNLSTEQLREHILKNLGFGEGDDDSFASQSDDPASAFDALRTIDGDVIDV